MEDSPSKQSVAELAGRLKGHILPMPGSNEEFRRRPPCSLKLHNPAAENKESDKSASPCTNKTKTKNSELIEKLQANLALSPSTLLPSPKAPDVKLQPTELSPTLPSSPPSPSQRPPHPPSEEEDPVGFDSPPEGTPLPSFNKNRPRLSFKRRPPTRQHRRSAGEEAGAATSERPPSEPDVPKENGDEDQVLHNLKEEADSGPKEAENGDGDCETMEAEAAQSKPDSRGDLEQEVERDSSAETLKEDQQPVESTEQTEEQDEADLPENDTM